jgi:hypothetical protein
MIFFLFRRWKGNVDHYGLSFIFITLFHDIDLSSTSHTNNSKKSLKIPKG